MAEPRTVPRQISAGVILVDRLGRVLLQLRDDNPSIMFPNHWGITGGAAHDGETPEQTARREVAEETGLTLDRFEPFRAYYFSETPSKSKRTRTEYELYLFHAPCLTPVEEMVCGEGQALRFVGPLEIDVLDIAYNHRDVLGDFFGSIAYDAYARGDAFDAPDDRIDPLTAFIAELDNGTPWFDALMEAVARWEQPDEQTVGRRYHYLLGGEAFDWLLLAERLLEAAGNRIPADDAARLLFEGTPPNAESHGMDDARLRALIGEAKHRAHLNYVYGVTVEEALQYAVELDLSKEQVNVTIRDRWDREVERDPVYQRIYGRTRNELLSEFREERGIAPARIIPLAELREFMYWLFKYRVKNSEPARVASDTRKALAQLSAMELAVRTRRRTPEPAPHV